MPFQSSVSPYLLSLLPRALFPVFFSSDPQTLWSLFNLLSRDASSRKPLLNPSDGGP